MNLATMDMCGNIFVSKDVQTFAIKCAYCKKSINDWHDFTSHIQELHNSSAEGEDEAWIDPNQYGDCQINIVIENIKPEELENEMKKEQELELLPEDKYYNEDEVC